MVGGTDGDVVIVITFESGRHHRRHSVSDVEDTQSLDVRLRKLGQETSAGAAGTTSFGGHDQRGHRHDTVTEVLSELVTETDENR